MHIFYSVYHFVIALHFIHKKYKRESGKIKIKNRQTDFKMPSAVFLALDISLIMRNRVALKGMCWLSTLSRLLSSVEVQGLDNSFANALFDTLVLGDIGTEFTGKSRIVHKSDKQIIKLRDICRRLLSCLKKRETFS